MNMRSKSSFPRPTLAALALAACVMWMGPSPAHAQSFNPDSALSPAQIERIISDSGYRLTGPVARHGRVYLANVLGQGDDPLRLVVDARNGRVLQRYPGRASLLRRQAAVPEESPLTNFFDRLFGSPEDAAPLSPPPDSDFLETPKPKAQARRPKPVVQPAVTAPSDNPATSAPPAAGQAATPPAGSGAPPPAAAVAKPTPETAAAAPGAPAQKAPSTKLNDVPVAPLE
ncbi:hypothetical protein [Methylocapsa sp. S129]|uniref:hypothetical protein n=1 Tax=Methylocapsa sp. S129 TaxID=1641869 RepID=UPI00131EB4DB|nr:hypothetical protein [Methylocapsa sp. S129]